MPLKTTHLTIVLSVAVLAGCASFGTSLGVSQYKAQFEKDPPTTQWLQSQSQMLREKAWAEPTKNNIEVFEYINGELNKRLEKEKREENWQAQTHRVLTSDWGNEGRGGAAMRQPAYIHVLAAEPGVFTESHHPVGLRDTNAMVASSFDKLPQLRSGSYSMYELSRWERYCNNGKGMDRRDWTFVVQEGLNNVPTALVGKCNPPASVKQLPR